MFTGDDISRLGEINKLNGLDHLPFWSEAPCNSIKASEGKYCVASRVCFALLLQKFVQDAFSSKQGVTGDGNICAISPKAVFASIRKNPREKERLCNIFMPP